MKKSELFKIISESFDKKLLNYTVQEKENFLLEIKVKLNIKKPTKKELTIERADIISKERKLKMIKQLEK